MIFLYTFFVLSSLAQESNKDFYWYKKEKQYLTLKNNKKWLHLTHYCSKEDISKAFPSIQIDSIDSFKIYFGKDIKNQPYEYSAYIKGNSLDNSVFYKNSMIKYVGNYYDALGTEIILSYFFFVKLKSLKDKDLLEKMAIENNLEILEQNEYMPEWFTLGCTKKTIKNALEMANYFEESKLFEAAQPNFYGGDIKNCTSDPLYPDQWNLDNTQSLPNTSIEACNAWNYTKGSPEIIVAVVDEGIDLNHIDLNIHSVSFDCTTGSSPSALYGSHGTNCAGVIAAHHNEIGVAGIAPNCKLMSISDPLRSNPTSRQNRARGIEFAWRNGASVISNSWGSSVRYLVIDDAIKNAIQNGRGGKGCVVVFSSGNYNASMPFLSAVNYPANSNPDILTVGGSSTCGDRLNSMNFNCFSWPRNFSTLAASCYGNELDIVAPGVEIPTTDNNNNFITNFQHTSSAAPHAAGVAALMLSINGNLTQNDVTKIIEKTAKKTGGYTYFTNPSRPHGRWYDEMGYGLLNAHDAVLNSICNTLTLNNLTFTGTTYQFDCKIYSEFTKIQSGGSLFEAKDEVILNQGFEANDNATFEVSIIGM